MAEHVLALAHIGLGGEHADRVVGQLVMAEIGLAAPDREHHRAGHAELLLDPFERRGVLRAQLRALGGEARNVGLLEIVGRRLDELGLAALRRLGRPGMARSGSERSGSRPRVAASNVARLTPSACASGHVRGQPLLERGIGGEGGIRGRKEQNERCDHHHLCAPRADLQCMCTSGFYVERSTNSRRIGNGPWPVKKALTGAHIQRPSAELQWSACILLKYNADEIMAKITVKGQVTLPKNVRDAVGLKPGDEVEVRTTASGGVYIGKPDASRRYRGTPGCTGEAATHPRHPPPTNSWKRAEAKFPLGPQSIGSEFGASSPHRAGAKWGAIARLDRAIQ